MTLAEGSLPAAYFDAVYAASDDPWSFETSAYEAGKYEAALAALGGRHFACALGVGCSIGVLTALLAPHCDDLLAVDVSEAALARARARCAALQQVRLAYMRVPDAFPPGRFDLVLTSEVAYYWSTADLERAADAVEACLVPGGLWLLVHWSRSCTTSRRRAMRCTTPSSGGASGAARCAIGRGSVTQCTGSICSSALPANVACDEGAQRGDRLAHRHAGGVRRAF